MPRRPVTGRPARPQAAATRGPAAAGARSAARVLVDADEATAIFDRLLTQHPNATTELAFADAYQLLVATMLSAQCTDARVNQVTPALFARYPDATTLATAEPEDLEPMIRPTGFFRMKSHNLVEMARALARDHGGRIPADMEALTKLPGVGRKTANVVLGHALGVPGFPVDRHVLRVANRIGLVRSEDPVQVEAALSSVLPPSRWTQASDTLILHGRRICRPRPLCDRCAIRTDCAFARKGSATARAARPPSARSTRPVRSRSLRRP
jgi:endonuclease III